MTGIVKLYDSLVSEYDRAQSEFKEADRNLRKLTGSRESANDSRGRSSTLPVDRNRKRQLSETSTRYESHRDSESNKSSKKLQSTIAKVSGPDMTTDLPEKTNLARKPEDRKGLARNRRMFGMILGTLQKFQTEESSRKDIMTKRENIERKLEEAAEQEKQIVKKEKDDFRRNMRQKKTELRKIELKIERVKIHQEWEKSMQCIGNFIQTKTKPSIFYCPAIHTPETEKKLKDSKDKFKLILAERRAKVQKELSEIEELYKKDMGEEEEEEAQVTCNLNEKPSIDNENTTKTDDLEMDVPCDQIKTEKDEIKTEENLTKANGKEGIRICRQDVSDESQKEEGQDGLEDKEFEPIYDE